MSPEIVATVPDLKSRVAGWRHAGERVALIPTMGALHEGHLTLVRAGRREADRTVVSIFVNPSQFAPNEDFAKYPRTFEADCALLAGVGADLVFAPPAPAMYPEGFATSVVPGGPARAGLEDAFRPHFFAGVATVVCKLLTQAAPDVALFGEKDYQQLRVVTRMAADLDLPSRILGVETVREPDGLAMSSRNRYLSAEDRARAALLPRVLDDCIADLRSGMPADAAVANGRVRLTAGGFDIDYLDLRDASTLEPVTRLDAPARLLVAARLGATRLIDNKPA